MKLLRRLFSSFIAAFIVGWLAGVLPDAMMHQIGSALSPKGVITSAALPTLRRLLSVAAGSTACLAVLVIIYHAAIISFIKRLARECLADYSALRRHIALARSEMHSSERMAIGFVFALGIGLRLWYINQPMQFDEATTVNMYASSPFYIGLVNYSSPNNHLLNTMLVRFSILATGDAEWSVRLSAFMAGIAVLFAALFYSTVMYSRTSGILTLAVISASMPFVDMATNARGYSFVALCGVMAHTSIYYMVTRRSKLAAVCYSMCVGLGLFAVPVAVLFVISSTACGAMYYLRRYSRTLEWKPIGLYLAAASCGIAIAIAGYAPMLITLGPRWLFMNEWVTPLSWADFVRQAPARLYEYSSYSIAGIPVVGYILLPALIMYSIFWARVERSRVPAPLIALGACLAVLALNRRHPFWGLSPMWMFLTVLCVSASCSIISAITRRWVGAPRARLIVPGMASLVCIVGASHILSCNHVSTINALGTHVNPQTKAIIDFLTGVVTTNDKIASDNAAAVYQYYTKRHGMPYSVWDLSNHNASTLYLIHDHKPPDHDTDMLLKLLAEYNINSLDNLPVLKRFEKADVLAVRLGNVDQ